MYNSCVDATVMLTEAEQCFCGAGFMYEGANAA